jgi:hypothetical protein
MDKKWTRFASTGSISDYLAYSGDRAQEYGVNRVDARSGSGEQERVEINERDHLAHRYGASSDTYRGI